MKLITVKSQAELDKALNDGVDWIEIHSPAGVWIEVRATGSATVRAYDSATVRAFGSATVRAYGSATVRAYDSATVRAYDSATVRAYDSATVSAYDSATVRAYGSATVSAYDSATVSAYDSATVSAYDSATVSAYGSATVSASGSATVRASGSATVSAYDSATVSAYDSATVSAYGSATVSAYGSATVSAYGSATVSATPLVAVHLHDSTVHVTGGTILDHTAVDLADARTWCEYHGVDITGGVATVYKAVNDQWTTDRGFDYSPGATPTAPDWDAALECGGGLHFGPTPTHTLAYHQEATRFLACQIDIATLTPILSGMFGIAKCKAPAVITGCTEVTINGDPVVISSPVEGVNK